LIRAGLPVTLEFDDHLGMVYPMGRHGESARLLGPRELGSVGHVASQRGSNCAVAAYPWREFRWRAVQKQHSGIYWSATEGRHEVYESRLGEIPAFVHVDRTVLVTALER
jgi:hypothetical protein